MQAALLRTRLPDQDRDWPSAPAMRTGEATMAMSCGSSTAGSSQNATIAPTGASATIGVVRNVNSPLKVPATRALFKWPAYSAPTILAVALLP